MGIYKYDPMRLIALINLINTVQAIDAAYFVDIIINKKLANKFETGAKTTYH